MNPPTNPPTIKDELERKAIDKLADVIRRNFSGDLTDNERKAAVEAIYDTVSGLVSKDVLDTIYAAVNEKVAPFVRKAVFFKPNEAKVIVLSSPVGAGVVSLDRYNISNVGSVQKEKHHDWNFGDEKNPNGAVDEFLTTNIDFLRAKGLVEL